MNACPSSEQLRLFLDSRLDPQLEETITAHVESCPPCEQELERLALSVDGDDECLSSVDTWRRLIERPGTVSWQSNRTAVVATAAPLLPSGATIGSYVIRHKLGRGGFGTVYLAHDDRLRRSVSVKVLDGPQVTAAERAGFAREAQAAARVKHAHVVSILDVGDAPGVAPYLVMEYVDGRSLAERLRDDGPFPIRDALDFARQAARGLEAIHGEQLVHRDIKPSNLLIDQRTGQIKIVDFGLARSTDPTDPASISRHVRGTIKYMSPEQIRGQRLDARSDLFSLGVVLYEALTGRRPFDGATDADTQLLVLGHHEPESPRLLNRNINRDVETAVLKCLEKSPDRRYASAALLAADLEACLDGRPPVARPVSSAERAWRWCRRKPAHATALAATFTLIVGLTIGWVVFAEQRAQASKQDSELAGERSQRATEAAARLKADTDLLRERSARQEARVQALIEQSFPFLTERFPAGAAAMVLASAQAGGDSPKIRRHLWDTVQRALVPTATSPRSVFTDRVVMHPDGRWLVTADRDEGVLRFWDGLSGELLHTLDAHRRNFDVSGWATVRGVVFDPADARSLVSIGIDGTLRVWKVEFPLAGPEGDGGGRVSASMLRRHPVDDATKSVALLAVDLERSRDPHAERLVVTGDIDGRLIWRDLATLTVRREVNAHAGPITSVRYRPDGRQCASTGWDGVVRLWDAAGHPLDRLPPVTKGDEPPVKLLDLAFSPDSRHVAASGGDGRVYVWQLDPPQLVHRLEGHTPNVHGERLVRPVVFLSDTRLLSGGADGTIREWDIGTGQQLRTLGQHERNRYGVQFVYGLAVSPNTDANRQRVASSGSDLTLRTWDVATGKQLLQARGSLQPGWRRPCFMTATARSTIARDAGTLITAWPSLQGLVQSWSTDNLQDPVTYLAEPDADWGDDDHHCLALAANPAGNRFVAARRNGDLHFWAVGAERPTIRRAAHAPAAGPLQSEAVTALVWSSRAEQNLVASAGTDRRLRLWNGNTGEPVGEPWPETEPDRPVAPTRFESPATRCLQFDSTAKLLLTAGQDAVVRVWDLDKREIVDRLNAPHLTPITALDFSRDGQFVATGSADGIISIWDWMARRLIRIIHVPALLVEEKFGTPAPATNLETGPATVPQLWPAELIQGVAFAPQSRWLAVAQADGSVTILDLAARQIVSRGVGHEPDAFGMLRINVHFTHRGELVTTGSDCTVRQWNLLPWDRDRRALSEGVTCQHVAAAPDGTEWAAVTMRGELIRWDRSGDVRQRWKPDDEQDGVLSLAYSPDPQQRRLVVGTTRGRVVVFDLRTGNALVSYSGPNGKRPADGTEAVVAVAVQPHGNLAASTWEDGTVDIWELATGRWRRSLPKQTQRLSALAFDPTGRQLAVAGDDGRLSIFDAQTGEPVHTDLPGPLTTYRICFSNDGRKLLQCGVGSGAAALLWDVASGKRLEWVKGHQPAVGNPANRGVVVSAAAFDPTGKWLATGGSDGTVRLWDANTLDPVAIISTKSLPLGAGSGSTRQAPDTDLAGPIDLGLIQDLAFSADGRELAVASQRGTVWTYDVARLVTQRDQPLADLHRELDRRLGLRVDNQRTIVPLSRNELQR